MSGLLRRFVLLGSSVSPHSVMGAVQIPKTCAPGSRYSWYPWWQALLTIHRGWPGWRWLVGLQGEEGISHAFCQLWVVDPLSDCNGQAGVVTGWEGTGETGGDARLCRALCSHQGGADALTRPFVAPVVTSERHVQAIVDCPVFWLVGPEGPSLRLQLLSLELQQLQIWG